MNSLMPLQYMINIINVYTYYDNSGDFGGDLSLCYILNSVWKKMPFNLGVSRFVTHISMAVAVGIKVLFSTIGLFHFTKFWATFSSVSIFVPFSKKLSVPVPVSLYHNICVECYIVWNVTIVSLKESERRNMETRLEWLKIEPWQVSMGRGQYLFPQTTLFCE